MASGVKTMGNNWVCQCISLQRLVFLSSSIQRTGNLESAIIVFIIHVTGATTQKQVRTNGKDYVRKVNELTKRQPNTVGNAGSNPTFTSGWLFVKSTQSERLCVCTCVLSLFIKYRETSICSTDLTFLVYDLFFERKIKVNLMLTAGLLAYNRSGN